MVCEVFFGLERAVAPNMQDGCATFKQGGRDEHVAVALEGVFFGAQDGEAEECRAFFDATDTFEKRSRLADERIEDVAARVVESGVFGAASDEIAERDVADACGFHGLPQSVSPEPGHAA